MADPVEKHGAFLEPLAAQGLAPEGTATVETPQIAWLEAAPEASPESPAPARKKVRAADRAHAASEAQEQATAALVSALQSDRPLLAALWADVPPGELLRTPPPEAAFQARCDWARRSLDLYARRDAEARTRAELAQRRLASELLRLEGQNPSPLVPALEALTVWQDQAFSSDLLVVAGPAKTLFASDRARWEPLAQQHGIDPNRVRALAERAGITVSGDDTRAWSPFVALPGQPASIDAVAESLLAHPGQGAELVRAGQVLDWLRANGASPELIARARDARMTAERGGAGTLAVHLQAWALGRRELRLGAVSLAAPGEIAPAIHSTRLTLDDLSRAAREGLLGAWLRLQGWVAAAGAADLVARGEPTALKRLAWSLGEPLVVGPHAFTDCDTLVRTVMAQASLREPLIALYAAGDLLAWLESLAPALRDEHWIDRLRRNKDPGDTRALWAGVYLRARCATLQLARSDGSGTVLGAVSQLCITADVAMFWDALRHVYRSGELHAWLAVVAPELASALPPPNLVDLEEGLNALLWALGHTGLVLEWGGRDLAIRTPSDLVRAYRLDWQRLEGLLARGHIFAWLKRFHGTTWLISPMPEVREGAGVAMVEVVDALAAEVGRLPAGHAALKLALVCGLSGLPSDPCAPGDDATFRGFTGATLRPNGDPARWMPLRAMFQQGTALVWLGMLPGLRGGLARSVLKNGFGPLDPRVDGAEHLQRVMVAVARDFGEPVASPLLAQEMGAGAPLVKGGATTQGRGARRHFPWGAVVGLMFLGAFLSLGVAWFTHEYNRDAMPQAPAPANSEVWVRLTVRLRADRTQNGAPWDLDNSLPELGAWVQTRDEPQRVGPCEAARECSAVFENVRLVPNVVFRVRVNEHDPLWTERLGEVLLRWRGGREEEIETRVAGVQLRVTVHKQSNPPAPLGAPAVPDAPMPPVPDPAPPTTPATRSRSRTRSRDAGVTAPRSSPRRAPSGPVVPGGRLEPLPGPWSAPAPAGDDGAAEPLGSSF